MPIDPVVAGTDVEADKVNEIISAINSLQDKILTSLSGFTWLKYNPATGTILGQGSRIASVTNFGNAIKILFDPPFPDADSYAGVATCTNVSGNAAGGGFAQIDSQTDDEIQFSFNSDDGDGGTPGIVNVAVLFTLDS